MSTRRLPLQMLAAVSLFLAASSVIGAHEFWVVLERQSVTESPTEVAIGFGEEFPRTLPLSADDAISVRVVRNAGDPLPIAQLTIDENRGVFKGVVPPSLGPGIYAVEAELRAKALTYSPEQFQAYLTREHLKSALDFRRALHEEGLPARETVTMFAKSVLRVGVTAEATAPVVGSKLELIPIGDPTQLRAGDSLHVRVRYINGSQSSTTVAASGSNGSAALPSLTAETNGAGEAAFVFPSAGVWLLHTVLTVPGPAHRGEPTEWESYWASLTVNVAARTPAAAVDPMRHR